MQTLAHARRGDRGIAGRRPRRHELGAEQDHDDADVHDEQEPEDGAERP